MYWARNLGKKWNQDPEFIMVSRRARKYSRRELCLSGGLPYTKSNSYYCINNMRLKSELYTKEHEEIVNKIICILDLQN